MSNTKTMGESLAKDIKQAQQKGKSSPETWNPPFCGDLDMEIRRDGTWVYLGTPIGRKELVKLFASVLRRENDKYYLVTPVEKVGIRVEDAAFTAVQLQSIETAQGPELKFITNVGDEITANAEHPIKVDTDIETHAPTPYIHVRNGLWALIARSVFYQMVDMAYHTRENNHNSLVIESAGHHFKLGQF